MAALSVILPAKSTVILPRPQATGSGYLSAMDLPSILERIEQRLDALSTNADKASRAAGRPDAIRNIRRAVATGRRGVSTQTIVALASALKTSPEWLLSGTGGPGEHIESDAILGEAPANSVPIVGYVGAGSETHFYPAGELDRVPAPIGAGARTCALEIRGKSIGAMFDRWIAYFDDVRSPVTDDLVGHLCVVGMPDDRVLVKKLGRKNGAFLLFSDDGSSIEAKEISWAARVTSLSPR